MSRPTPAAARDETEVRKQAVAWYARLCSGGAGEADHQAWRRWHDAHPDHQRAWLRIEAMRAALLRVPSEIAMSTLRVGADRLRRRQALRGVLLLASTGALGYLSYRGAERRELLQPLLARHRTGVGERRDIMLDDGSLLALNTDSAVDVFYSDTRRVLRLWSGEILVETAKHRGGAADPRPFSVETAHGSVTALGTRFIVRQLADATEVTVLDETVALRAADSLRPLLLRAGQRARFTRGDIGAPSIADEGAAAWRSGKLLVNDRSLAEVLAELSRYRHGRLGCDDAVAGLRISGVFPLDDTERALTLLTQAFPLRLRSMTRYWVTLAPREKISK